MLNFEIVVLLNKKSKRNLWQLIHEIDYFNNWMLLVFNIFIFYFMQMLFAKCFSLEFCYYCQTL